MIQTAIKKIVDKQDLTYEEAYSVMNRNKDGRDISSSECGVSCSFVNEKYKGGDNRRNFRMCRGNERARRKGRA